MGAPAFFVDISSPSTIAFMHDSGDMLILSETQHAVRLVLARSGLLIPFAGNGTGSFGGDGGSAQLAALSSPSDLVVHADNSVLIADKANNRIRKVLPNGTMTTWLGDGVASGAGDGLQRSFARVSSPVGLAIHPITSDVFIVENGGARVRRVDARTDFVWLFIGQPAGSMAQVYITMSLPRILLPLPGTRDMFLLADFCMIYRVNSTSGTASVVAGNSICGNSGDGGSAATSRIGTVAGLAIDPATGAVFVSDYTNSVVRAFTIGGMLWRLASETPGSIPALYGGAAANVSISGPSGIAWHPTSGSLVIAESSGNRVRAVPAACRVAPTAVSAVLCRVGRAVAVANLSIYFLMICHLADAICCHELTSFAIAPAERELHAHRVRVYVELAIAIAFCQQISVVVTVSQQDDLASATELDTHFIADAKQKCNCQLDGNGFYHRVGHSDSVGHCDGVSDACTVHSDQARFQLRCADPSCGRACFCSSTEQHRCGVTASDCCQCRSATSHAACFHRARLRRAV